MTPLQFKKARISGLVLIQPQVSEDKRGYFLKVFEKNVFLAHEISLSPHEELRSCSKKGVLRGLHFQREHAQDKLVHVLNGAIYDVAVDLRKGSDTFGKWEGFYLSEKNKTMLYIPRGFAHGFLSLEEGTVLNYLCGNQYNPEADGGILWEDPTIAVQWPLEKVEEIIVCDKDKALPTLEEFLQKYGELSDEVVR